MAALLLAACLRGEVLFPEDESTSALILDASILDFGEAAFGEGVRASFSVSNGLSRRIDVKSLGLTGDSDSFEVEQGAQGFALGAGESREFEVVFRPQQPDQLDAQLILRGSQGGASLVLTGFGSMPKLAVTPDPYDFGTVFAQCSRQGQAELLNLGTAPALVEEIGVRGAGFEILDLETAPLTLGPGDSQALDLQFLPQRETAYQGLLSVKSDAPASPLRATLLGEGIYEGEYVDSWENSCSAAVDLLFSVDQSGSMDDDRANLANNFGTFITHLSNYSADWRILVANDDDGCNNSGVLDLSTPDYGSTFASAVFSGGGDLTEALLAVSANAVEQTGSGECNQGFLRSDALLHIILVSDTADQSPDSWSDYLARVVAEKGDQNLVVYSVVGPEPSGCGPKGTGGYLNAVLATEGVYLSICSDWANDVEELASVSRPQTSFPLSQQPDPDTLSVEVGGELRAWGWSYDAELNQVEFGNDPPQCGDSVRISYSTLGDCGE